MKFKIKRYIRNGKPVFLDLARDILVPVTNEEEIRQKLLSKLLNTWNVPKKFIIAEESMSHYKKGAKDRADIIILHPKTEKPWILFEVKAPEVYICDDTFEQAEKYNKNLKCKYICLSNGNVEQWFLMKKNTHAEIEKPNSIDELLSDNIKYAEYEPYVRPTLTECKSKKLSKIYVNDYCAIGKDTPMSLHPFIINLYGFLMEEKNHIKRPIKLKNFSIVKDGIRNTTFGNMGGGTYDGFYRYFIIEYPNGDTNIISISVFGTIKTINDPHWGTRNSYTSLVVAIDDYDKKHNSLQLNLDKNLMYKSNKWSIYHNGRLTTGKRGAAKIDEVLGFCKKNISDLIEDNQVCLGDVPDGSLLTWKNCGHLIINLIRYAIVRDKYRERQKEE